MSSTNMILGILQKKYHHELGQISVEEILEVLRELNIEIGMLQNKTEVIKENQKFLENLLMNRLKDGVGL